MNLQLDINLAKNYKNNSQNIGKIFLVKNKSVFQRDIVLENWRKTVFLKDNSKELKRWTLDILSCIDKIEFSEFKLSDIRLAAIC